MSYAKAPLGVKTMIDNIIKVEGGYADDPQDKGGKTMYGITEKVARNNGYKGDMKDLPLSFAQDVYVNQYYYKPKFNLVYIVNPSLAEECTDSGVNMGTKWPSLWLQGLLNAFNNNGKMYADIVEDGVIGTKTINALNSYKALRGTKGMIVLYNAMNSLQTARYYEIVKKNKSQERFFWGWINQRVDFLPF